MTKRFDEPEADWFAIFHKQVRYKRVFQACSVLAGAIIVIAFLIILASSS